MRCGVCICSGTFALGLAVRINDEQSASADYLKVREGVQLARKHIRAWDFHRKHQLNQRTTNLEKTDRESKRLMAVLPHAWAEYKHMKGFRDTPDQKDSGSAWSVMTIMVDLLMLVTAGALEATGGGGACPLLFTVCITATWFVFGFFTLGETKLEVKDDQGKKIGMRAMKTEEQIVKLTESFTSVGYGRSSPDTEEWVLKFSHALHTWVGTAVVNGYISVWFSALMDCVEMKLLDKLKPLAYENMKWAEFLRFLKITVWFGAWVFIVFPLLFADAIDGSGGNYMKNVYFTIMTGTTIGYGDLNAGIDRTGEGGFDKKSQLLMYTAGSWMPAAVELFGRFAAAAKGDASETSVNAWMCGTEDQVKNAEPPCPAPVIGQACTYFYKTCAQETLLNLGEQNRKKDLTPEQLLKVAKRILQTLKVKKLELQGGETKYFLTVGLNNKWLPEFDKPECNPDECNDQLQVECAVQENTGWRQGTKGEWQFLLTDDTKWELCRDRLTEGRVFVDMAKEAMDIRKLWEDVMTQQYEVLRKRAEKSVKTKELFEKGLANRFKKKLMENRIKKKLMEQVAAVKVTGKPVNPPNPIDKDQQEGKPVDPPFIDEDRQELPEDLQSRVGNGDNSGDKKENNEEQSVEQDARDMERDAQASGPDAEEKLDPPGTGSDGTKGDEGGQQGEGEMQDTATGDVEQDSVGEKEIRAKIGNYLIDSFQRFRVKKHKPMRDSKIFKDMIHKFAEYSNAIGISRKNEKLPKDDAKCGICQEHRKEMKAMVVGEAIFHIVNQNVRLRKPELTLACDRTYETYENDDNKKEITEEMEKMKRLCGCVLNKEPPEECTNSETEDSKTEENNKKETGAETVAISGQQKKEDGRTGEKGGEGGAGENNREGAGTGTVDISGQPKTENGKTGEKDNEDRGAETEKNTKISDDEGRKNIDV